jgi:hypothetical protein
MTPPKLYPEDLRLLADLADAAVTVSLELMRGHKRGVVRRNGVVLHTVNERVIARLREAGLIDDKLALTEQGLQRVVG